MSSQAFELKNEIVRAGAGAGKTTKLTKKVIEIALDFFSQNGDWPNLVITTFTRKATQELRERLIIEAYSTENPDLIEYVSSPTRLFISTIHGVLGQFLRRYGHLVGVDPSFSIVSSREGEMLSRSVLKELLLEAKVGTNLLEEKSFRELIVLCRRFYEIKMAFPDAKSVDISRLEKLYKEFLNESISGFSNDLITAKNSIPTGVENWEQYFSQIEKIVRNISELVPSELPSGNEILEMLPKSPRLVGKAISDCKSDIEKFRIRFKKYFTDPLKKEGFQKSNWQSFIDLSKSFDLLGEEFLDELYKRKLDLAKIEMSDIELISLKCLRDEPGVGQAFSSDWDFWLIDEFQDTSPIQIEILDHLIGNKKAFVVGDPQQSIYLFRGARSEVFEQRQKYFEKIGGVLGSLQKNWRSDPELLLFFNDFFSQVGNQFKPMEPKAEELDPKKVVATFLSAAKGEEAGESKTQIEDAALVSEIRHLIGKGERLENICVLARTNKVLKQIGNLLEGAGVSSHIHSSAGFFNRREILDALGLLKFIANPHDNTNLILLLRSPWLRISDAKLSRVFSEAPRGESHWFRARKNLGDNSVVRYLEGLIERSRGHGFSKTLRDALIELGMIDLSHLHDPTGRRESNLWKLLTQLRQEERGTGFNVINFINQSTKSISESEGEDESDAVAALEPNRVNLMTIHASKGLQFKHVFLPRLNQGGRVSYIAPPILVDEENRDWSITKKIEEVSKASLHGEEVLRKLREREMLESQRVLYVALTRAKETVFLSWTGSPKKGSWAEFCEEYLNKYPQGNRESYGIRFMNGGEEIGGYGVEKGEGASVEVRPLYVTTESDQKWKKIPATRYLSALNDLKNFSQILGTNSSEGTLTNSELGQKSLAASEKANLGNLIHKALEILKYDPEFDFQNSGLFIGEDGAELLYKAVGYVKREKSVPVLEIIKNGEVEWGFQYLSKHGIIEGQVDLWGVTKTDNGETLWVVDYKSGSARYKENAFNQLKLYGLALMEHLDNIDEIKLAVVYPIEETIEVRHLPPKEDLKAELNL